MNFTSHAEVIKSERKKPKLWIKNTNGLIVLHIRDDEADSKMFQGVIMAIGTSGYGLGHWGTFIYKDMEPFSGKVTLIQDL